MNLRKRNAEFDFLKTHLTRNTIGIQKGKIKKRYAKNPKEFCKFSHFQSDSFL